ncbi:MAG: hypothetical protein Q7U74_01340 [Saprospiraceae bacterium]|nr:hypothetical protein [Saprospiraceae bacterium]
MESHGLLDDDFLSELFYAFYARCQSILTCAQEAQGRVNCPRCNTIIQRKNLTYISAGKAEMMICPHCAWQLTWGEYLQSYQGKQLFIGGAGPAIQSYVDNFSKTSTPQSKILLIDTLIHAYHWEATSHPTRPVSVNRIGANARASLTCWKD